MEVGLLGDASQLLAVLVKLALLALAGTVVFPLCFGIVYTTYSRILGAMRTQVFKHTQNLPVSYIETHYSGDIVSRISNDLGDASQLFGYPTVGQDNPLAKMITVIATAAIIFSLNWILGLVALAFGAVGVGAALLLARPIQIAETQVKEQTAVASQGVINTLGGIVVARLFGLEDKLAKGYQGAVEQIFTINRSIITKKALFNAAIRLQIFFAMTGVTTIGLVMASQGLIAIPLVVFIASLQAQLAFTIGNLGQAMNNLQGYIASARRLLEFLDAPEETQRPDLAVPDYHFPLALDIKNLDFAYQPETPVFTQLSLEVPRGQVLAIVGGSGGGKSTLFKLLQHFYPSPPGTLEIFGHDSHNYSLARVRSNFAYVPQDSYLFDASIADNIGWGNPAAGMAEIRAAASRAYLDEFILSLPQGYDTRVGERGTHVSGGQRQRIAIARAFLKDAPIVLLDEATSALDSACRPFSMPTGLWSLKLVAASNRANTRNC
jgi:ATP-binding cassette subfamily B protein